MLQAFLGTQISVSPTSLPHVINTDLDKKLKVTKKSGHEKEKVTEDIDIEN